LQKKNKAILKQTNNSILEKFRPLISEAQSPAVWHNLICSHCT